MTDEERREVASAALSQVYQDCQLTVPSDHLAHWLSSLSLSFPIYYKSRLNQHDPPGLSPLFLKNSLVPRERDSCRDYILPGPQNNCLSSSVFSINPGSLPACVQFLVVVVVVIEPHYCSQL